MASFMYSEPRNRPLQNLKLHSGRVVPKPCINSNSALPEELPIPQFCPALRRVTEQAELRPAQAPTGTHACFLTTDMESKNHRTWFRGEQTGDVLRELELGFFGAEEVEDGAYGNGRDVSAEGVQRRHS